MSYEAFITGVGGIVLGALIGSWITARLTYKFQKALLKQQLGAQKQLHEEMLSFQKESQKELLNYYNEVGCAPHITL